MRFALPKLGLLAFLLPHLASCGGSATKSDSASVCAVQPLAKVCPDPQSCPAGPDQVTLNCDSPYGDSTRAATTCGGSVVRVNYALGGASWYFDAEQKLVGLRSVSDTGPVCGEEVGVTIYGKVCDALGEAEDLCLAACTDQAPLEENGATPKEEDFDFISRCEPASQVVRAASICGGTVYAIRRNDGTFERYCFDEAGRLIGSSQYYELGTPPVTRGVTCKPSDPEQDLCAPAVGIQDDRCKVQPLSEYCGNSDRCPAGPDDVVVNCGASFTSTRSATVCAGTVIETDYGLSGSSWYFDANGKLVGLRNLSDTGPICYDASGLKTYGVRTYGTICDAVGEAADLCLAACTEQTPLVIDGVMLTEESYDFLSYCSETATQVIRATTICGGKQYLVRREEYGTSESYCFDEAGRLIGSFTFDPQGAPVTRGTTCKPSEAEENLCPQ